MRRLPGLLAPLLAALLALALAGSLAPAATAAPVREKWDTEVFSLVPSPGYPAYVHAHTNRRVYAGTYLARDPRRSSMASKVFEWSGDGALLRSWRVPGQDLEADHGVQVAHQTRDGELVLLEISRPRVLTLDPRTGRFRTVARLPEGAVPNFATWGPGGLYVTDYGDGVIWRVRRSGRVQEWFRAPELDGVAGFGTTGIRYLPGRRELLIAQQTLVSRQTGATGATLPTNGALLRLPVDRRGRAGELSTLWTSQPTDLPDGFGIGRSGHIYLALAGLTAQLVEITPDGEEVGRFPRLPVSGDNGSAVPFDTASSATFLGTSVLVANQSAIAGDASHQAILDVEVGERGRAAYLPRRARFR